MRPAYPERPVKRAAVACCDRVDWYNHACYWARNEACHWSGEVRLLRRSAIALLCAWMSGVCAQAASVDRAANGPSGKPIQIGLYLNVRPDCTAGPLPTIRLTVPPEHGKVVVKKAKVSATNVKQCLAFEVPGLVAFYQSQPNFAGLDALTLEVKFPGGRMELQKITVTVGPSSPVQGV